MDQENNKVFDTDAVYGRRCVVSKWVSSDEFEVTDCNSGETYRPEKVATSRVNCLGHHGTLIDNCWHPDG